MLAPGGSVRKLSGRSEGFGGHGQDGVLVFSSPWREVTTPVVTVGKENSIVAL